MLTGIAIGVAILALAGLFYQAAATARDKRTYPPPGQLVDLGGRRLHLLVRGDDTGQPTVLLEAGMASFSSNWHWVQTDLAADTRVVAPDRAGLGWSDPPPSTHDAHAGAADLHAALAGAGISGPYVVTGHSYGGLVARAFADLYPDEVAGMVLVDASHPDQWARITASRNGQVNAFSTRLLGWLAWLGVVRAFDIERGVRQGLPERPAAEMRAILNRPQSWQTAGTTLAIWHEQTRPRINQARPLGDLPLVVLGVTEQAMYGDILTELQDELATLSINSLRLTVQGATHENLIGDEAHAREVAAAIRRVLAAARTGRPLAEVAPAVDKTAPSATPRE